MPSPVIRYAITDRRLRAADEGGSCAAAAPALCPLRAAELAGVAGFAGVAARADGLLEGRQAESQLPGGDLQRLADEVAAADLANLLAQAQQLRTTGVDYLQVREKDLAPASLRALATALRGVLAPGTPPRLLLNLGRPEDHQATLATALAVAADGVHLPGGSAAGLFDQIRATFRRACRSTPVLSGSAHSLAEVAAARAACVDLILFGPVFGKTVFLRTGPGTEPASPSDGRLVSPAVGLDLLTEAVRLAHPTPVLALGGVTAANTPAVLAAGAAGVAGIRLFR